jgi:hypothetical protein
METSKNSMLASFDQKLAEYKTLLESHDWYYSWSDDNRVWSSGEQNLKRLKEIAEFGGLAYQILFNEEYQKHFNEGCFKTSLSHTGNPSCGSPPFKV